MKCTRIKVPFLRRRCWNIFSDGLLRNPGRKMRRWSRTSRRRFYARVRISALADCIRFCPCSHWTNPRIQFASSAVANRETTVAEILSKGESQPSIRHVRLIVKSVPGRCIGGLARRSDGEGYDTNPWQSVFIRPRSNRLQHSHATKLSFSTIAFKDPNSQAFRKRH